ncbi:MAG: acyl-CoA thioesterase [Bacteroidota bacterium]|nr:acyl-CoA thioesterase [Bacteroidota bacterium]MDP3144646.1 acyl-CoA thioesterase [Bacteroidota bacterium]MDP3556585.1 acyl-CoA thioesterase [Bacteroidota bacterium]
MKSKTPSQSVTINTEVVLPNDTNHVGNLFGGKLLQWVDITAAIAAQRHCGRVVVTAAINHVSFENPISQNSIVTLEAKVSRAFTSSMEIFVDVFVENPVTGVKTKCNEAILTFVAIDQNGSPLPVPALVPETEIEQKRFDSALRRRQLSLILGGRMKPEEATELRALFMKD